MSDTDLRQGPMHPGMLLWYLDRFCGKQDAVTFFDRAGQPDLAAARAYAEELRERLATSAKALNGALTIEQRNHMVVVSSTMTVPPRGDRAWYLEARQKMLAAYGPQAQAQRQAGRQGRRSGRGSRPLAPA